MAARTRVLTAAAGVFAAFAVPLLVMQWLNPRLLTSWHGFLHAGIAERFPAASLPPENPFFAGEPLPYYWFYHALGAALSGVAGIDLLLAFRFIVLLSIAAIVAACMRFGAAHLRAPAAGVLAVVLVLIGVNPLGPAIAAAKAAGGEPAFVAIDAPIETEVVTNDIADAYMAHPLLGLMYFGEDWRAGQNLSWLLDVSARTPSLALLVVLAALLGGSLGVAAVWRVAAIILVMGLSTALNPLAGMAVGGAVIAAAVVLRVLGRKGLLAIALATFAGALLAWPTYSHLFGVGGAGFAPSTPAFALRKLIAAGVNFVVLLPLAALGAARARAELRPAMQLLAGAGAILVGGFVFVYLPEGNEHNLANAAQCLLAIPAVAWIPELGATRRAVWIGALLLPAGLATLLAFSGRPDLPLGSADGRIVRTDSIGADYAWIRTHVPGDAVLVTDPDQPVRMAGNVTEVPAFTGRPVFVDHPSYLTEPYEAFGLRLEAARRLQRGEALTAEQAAELASIGRPLWLVIRRPDPERLDRLRARHGPEAHAGALVLFRIEPGSQPSTPIAPSGAGPG